MKLITLLIAIFTFISFANTQCASAPAQQTCAVGCTPLTNNANVNTGQTYCYSGNGTLSGINMAGGTIIVCGNLTISSWNYNSGSIYVASGGNLNVSSTNFNNALIVNYGTINVSGNATFQPATVYNASGTSSFNVTGQTTFNNSSVMVNNGTFNSNALLLQGSSSPALCLANGSTNAFSTLTNNTSNSISAPGGNACISVSTQLFLNPSSLSSTSALQICLASGASQAGGGGVGSATLYTNCAACAVNLPLEITDFTAHLYNRIAYLNWTTEQEKNGDYFELYRSKDGINYELLNEQTAQLSINNHYIFLDLNPLEGLSYYQLKKLDISNSETYNATKTIYNAPFDLISIFPNPASDQVTIALGAPRDLEAIVQIFDENGKIVMTNNYTVEKGVQTITIPVQTLAKGIYHLKITTDIIGEQVESIFFK